MIILISVAIVLMAVLLLTLKNNFTSSSKKGIAIFIKVADSDMSMSRRFFTFARLTKYLNEFTVKNTNIKLVKTVSCDRILFYVDQSETSEPNLVLEVQKLSQYIEKLVSNDFNGIDYTIGCSYGQIMLAQFNRSSVDIFCDSMNCAARMAYLENSSFKGKTRMCFAENETQLSELQNLESVLKVDVKGKGVKIVYRIP